MSAQESTIATLQQQLHAENVRRFGQIEANLERQNRTLETIVSQTAGLQGLKKKVEDMETERNKIKGAAKVATWIAGTGLGTEVLRWLFFRK